MARRGLRRESVDSDDPSESESLVDEELDERGLETGDEDEEDEEVGEL